MKVAVCEDQPEVWYILSKILSELPIVKKIEVYSGMDMCLGETWMREAITMWYYNKTRNVRLRTDTLRPDRKGESHGERVWIYSGQ